MAKNLERYRVRILCEDKAQYEFMRNFLTNQGVINNRRILPCLQLPEGTQSGEQFVKENFSSEYQKYTRAHENIILVVVQDIDKRYSTFEEAKNAFEIIIRSEGLNGFTSSDKLMLVFPKRNIETWLEWLKQDYPTRTVSEDNDYKMRNRDLPFGKFGKHASDLYTKSLNDSSVCDTAPKSLVSACEEFKNLCVKL